MRTLLDRLVTGLKGSPAATRVLVALVGLGLAAVLGLAALVSSHPHFELAFSGLTDHELAQVCKALSEAGIPFEQSQPPAPFQVYVDEDRRSSAYMAAYGAGALDKPLEGILATDGVASVFSSAEERAQGVRKREWQEMEKMLEELDFVAGARVRTAPVPSSPLAGGAAAEGTASVTLRLTGQVELTAAQSETVANLVGRGLGIDKSRLVISDQGGRSLYDGEQRGSEGTEVKDLLAHQVEHDRRLAREATAVLEQILGPNKARVSVTSEWDYAQSTLRKDTTGKGTVVQETKSTSEKPIASASSANAVGVAGNTLDPDLLPARDVAAAPPPVEKTSEEKKEYAPTVTREERVRLVPELERLSVALFLDQSIQQEAEKLEEAIKAAVGFDEERRDGFRTVVLPFVALPAPDGAATPATPVSSEPDPLLELALRHGIEILSAAAFLVLLLRTLRGSRPERKAAASGAPTPAGASADVDAELLARAQIDELLKSDPAKVGEILARWAREEPAPSR